MRFEELANTFFFRLPLFKRRHGFFVDDLQSKSDLLTYKKASSTNGKLDFYRPEKLSFSISSFSNVLQENGSLSYTCTEENLITLFQSPEKIVINEYHPVALENLSKYSAYYKEGYEKGIERPIISELGKSYQALDINTKIEILKDFCQLCHQYSFFEGFTVPDCLKGIGYMQGMLFTGFKEYALLTSQKKKEMTLVEVTPKLHSLKALNVDTPQLQPKELVPKSDSTDPDLRIPIKSRQKWKDLGILWALLLYPIEESPITITSKSEIHDMLSLLFILEGEATNNHRIFDLSIFESRNRSQIEFLMRFSKLIIEGPTQNNSHYCNLLKSKFSGIYGETQAHAGISVKSIASHWMEKTNEFLQILRKHQPPKQIFDLINSIMIKNDFKSKRLTQYK